MRLKLNRRKAVNNRIYTYLINNDRDPPLEYVKALNIQMNGLAIADRDSMKTHNSLFRFKYNRD